MLRLRTFDGLSIERDDKSLPSTGPRRRLLALLALVAGHDASGISRDKLLAYLWPESNTRYARNNLKQALYSLRQSLEIPLVNYMGGVIRLDPRRIDVDLWQFESAVARGDDAGAARVYRGPFLDGFYVSGLYEFERWMASKRERLARSYGDALHRLGERAEAEGNRVAAVKWWRRSTEADPLCSIAALGLMRALAAAGDPTAARQHARIHAAYVRAELGGPVCEAVVAFANRLRSDAIAHDPAASVVQSETSSPIPLVPRDPERRSGPVTLSAEPAVKHARSGLLPPVPRAVWLATAALWALTLLFRVVHVAL